MRRNEEKATLISVTKFLPRTGVSPEYWSGNKRQWHSLETSPIQGQWTVLNDITLVVLILGQLVKNFVQKMYIIC